MKKTSEVMAFANRPLRDSSCPESSRPMSNKRVSFCLNQRVVKRKSVLHFRRGDQSIFALKIGPLRLGRPTNMQLDQAQATVSQRRLDFPLSQWPKSWIAITGTVQVPSANHARQWARWQATCQTIRSALERKASGTFVSIIIFRSCRCINFHSDKAFVARHI